ncbi:histone deacetylase complex subunit SAP130-like isoform X2 [Ostrea edulis]|uniref:histone deacetylase complex subunit SAP130-like isoform X2 n=1 Tax=Ostrea edulis TaxID=37623 RepID=UPI0024AE8D73|nr:histone deacetylase complex subunit SAP130-like isoform X2 [Ostrea edulis]
MSNRTVGEREDPSSTISSSPAVNLHSHAVHSHLYQEQLQAASKTLNQTMVPINLSSGKAAEGASLAIIPQGIEIPKSMASMISTPAISTPSSLPLISSASTPTIPQGSIVQISPGSAASVSSILRGGTAQNPGFASHLPKGAMAAASALAGPKSMTALPMVRHPTVNLQSPGTKVQTASLIRSTTPPTSKSPTPGVTISVTQANEGTRTNVTVQSTAAAPQGSIQITLQAPRPAGEGPSKSSTMQRTIDVQKPLIQALRTTTVDTAPKTIITTQVRPVVDATVKSVIAGSFHAKQGTRHTVDPVIRPPKTIHVPQTSALSGSKVLLTQASNSSVSPHNLVASQLKTNKGITIPSSSSAALSVALSSVTTTTTAIPIAKVPPVRQPPLSLAPHTVSSTLPVTPSTLDRQRLETSNPGTAPLTAHSTSTASLFMPHRTQPSTSLTAPSTLTHTERPALSSQLYPYFIPPDYLMHYQMQALANAQPSVHAIPTISTSSNIRTGLLPTQTPNLTASLQAAHTFSGTAGAAVRFNQSQPVVVTMDTIRAQQALSGNLPFTASTTVPETTARPTTPTESIPTLSSPAAAAIPIPALTVMGQCNPMPNYPSTPVTPQNSQSNSSSTPVSTPNASPRPSILRKRTNEGPVKKPVCGLNTMDRHSPRPDSRTDSAPQSNTSSPKTPVTPAGESQSSTDTALSSEATTPTQNNMADLKIKQEPMDGLENGLSAAISSSIASLSNSLPNSMDASPRKKPRKQLLNANEEFKDAVSSDEEKVAIENVKEEEEDIVAEFREEFVDEEGVRWTVEKCRPNVSLMNFYNISWKPRNNHFNRHTDIKPKEERRPTVNELANQRGASQKASGWKLYHMAAQMEDLNDLEKTLLSKLSSVQTTLTPRHQNKLSMVCVEDELSMMHELTQANIQRCKLIMDQLEESRTNMLKVLDHKQKISEIINKHVSKRPIKKKERS